ncbi:MAG: SPOR domain-containing protein [Gammaproteobacteria bacterium]
MQVGLKERLIGAAVLVVIAAIVIPWVLKGNSTPGGTTVSKPLTLPPASTAAPVPTVRLPLNTTGAPASPVVSGATASAAAMPAAVPPVAQAPVTPKPRASAPEAAHSPSANAPLTAVRTGKWVVQVGSYDNEHSARSVETKLAAHGYHAYVSRYRAKGRTYYRVRVGPYATRTTATHELAGVNRAAGTKALVMPNS